MMEPSGLGPNRKSWEKSLGAASQGAVAFNGRLLDIAARNVSRGFDLATNLVEAKNLSDAMQVQANYWRKHFDELSRCCRGNKEWGGRSFNGQHMLHGPPHGALHVLALVNNGAHISQMATRLPQHK
jgi:hypothetical protein